MSNIITLTTLNNNNIKKAMDKLKECGLFMNQEHRKIYLDNLKEDDIKNLYTIISKFKNNDDNIKSSLLEDVLKELGIKTLSLDMMEELLMVKDNTIDLLKDRIEQFEQEKIDAILDREQKEIKIREYKQKQLEDLDKININLIKRNTDPILRYKMLSKAINNK